jgi:hypothetical protein
VIERKVKSRAFSSTSYLLPFSLLSALNVNPVVTVIPEFEQKKTIKKLEFSGRQASLFLLLLMNRKRFVNDQKAKEKSPQKDVKANE